MNPRQDQSASYTLPNNKKVQKQEQNLNQNRKLDDTDDKNSGQSNHDVTHTTEETEWSSKWVVPAVTILASPDFAWVPANIVMIQQIVSCSFPSKHSNHFGCRHCSVSGLAGENMSIRVKNHPKETQNSSVHSSKTFKFSSSL